MHEVYLEQFDAARLPDDIRDYMSSLKESEWVKLDPSSISWAGIPPEELGSIPDPVVKLTHESTPLPYRAFPMREFDLMKKGLKPLSVFSHMPSDFIADAKKYFGPLVARNELVENQYDDETLLYALPGEAWRLQAYGLMRSLWRASKWNDTLELMEGMLLGYSAEQNDAWVEYRKMTGDRWGLQRLYRFISSDEARRVKENGCKAFLPGSDDGDTLVMYVPQGNPDEREQQLALRGFQEGCLTGFYVSILKIEDLRKGVVGIGGRNFDRLELPRDQCARLNRDIDGFIDLLDFEDMKPGQ